MENSFNYAPLADIECTLDIFHEQCGNSKASIAAGAIISLINMCAISESDNVLVMAIEREAISCVVTYLYTPASLTSLQIVNKELLEDDNTIHTHKGWELFKNMLPEYDHREPSFVRAAAEDAFCIKKCFNVLIGNFISNKKDNLFSRYEFDKGAGSAYDAFETSLKSVSGFINEDGRLILIIEPIWIIKAWQLFEELGLQLDYQSNHIYLDNEKKPHEPVILRFVKCKNGFNPELQKRNILKLMEISQINRLHAQKNDSVYPYSDLTYENTDTYVELEQNLKYQQYFFTPETTSELVKLCTGYTACLVTPSIAMEAVKQNRNVILFEKDNRFRQIDGLKFVKYDLDTGLNPVTSRKFAKRFNTVICDPPFNIKTDTLAKNIMELLNPLALKVAYIVFPSSKKAILSSAMRLRNFVMDDSWSGVAIKYGKPPKIVRLNGKDAIQIYKFNYISERLPW